MPSELEILKRRLDGLEAQHALTAGFVRFLLEATISELPEEHQAPFRKSFDVHFERLIAYLLASGEHTEASIQAVETMRDLMFGVPQASPQVGE